MKGRARRKGEDLLERVKQPPIPCGAVGIQEPATGGAVEGELHKRSRRFFKHSVSLALRTDHALSAGRGVSSARFVCVTQPSDGVFSRHCSTQAVYWDSVVDSSLQFLRACERRTAAAHVILDRVLSFHPGQKNPVRVAHGYARESSDRGSAPQPRSWFRPPLASTSPTRQQASSYHLAGPPRLAVGRLVMGSAGDPLACDRYYTRSAEVPPPEFRLKCATYLTHFFRSYGKLFQF